MRKLTNKNPYLSSNYEENENHRIMYDVLLYGINMLKLVTLANEKLNNNKFGLKDKMTIEMLSIGSKKTLRSKMEKALLLQRWTKFSQH